MHFHIPSKSQPCPRISVFFRLLHCHHHCNHGDSPHDIHGSYSSQCRHLALLPLKNQSAKEQRRRWRQFPIARKHLLQRSKTVWRDGQRKLAEAPRPLVRELPRPGRTVRVCESRLSRLHLRLGTQTKRWG